MFRKIQYRLLLYYLVVFASILGAFAIAVRLLFTHSSTQQLTEKLAALGQGAAANSEFDQGHFKIGEDFSTADLIARGQALQWFNPQGQLITQQGKTQLVLPFVPNTVQIQASQPRLLSVTLPILSNDDQRLIGHIRVSQSLEEADENLRKLDLGLSGGIIMALILSSIGGIWLTRQAMQPIETSFQQLQQFTADASHELRSPLMAIKSNVGVALKYPDGMRSTDIEKFQAIASATTQMTQLTEDLLLLARFDQANHNNFAPVNLTELLENLIKLYESPAQAKRIALKSQLKQLNVSGNAAQLIRLFTNLIVNALHYTAEGGTIDVQAKRIGQHLIITITDTGIGIAPEHLTKIFDRFWCADQSRVHWSGGSGLGLAIAQTIAKSHGGMITVTSQVGIGSCFSVSLPNHSTL